MRMRLISVNSKDEAVNVSHETMINKERGGQSLRSVFCQSNLMKERKKEMNREDFISSLRIVDDLLVKFTDFLLSVPFLNTPILWKVIVILCILTMPIRGILFIFTGFAGFIFGIAGNVIGISLAVVALSYLIWFAKATLFNPESDLKLSNLHGWSKLMAVIMFISLVVSSVQNIWLGSIFWVVPTLIGDFITITLVMVFGQFMNRYFIGVVIDELDLHPDSKHRVGATDHE